MMKNMRMGVPSLFKGGTKHFTGLEASILRNIEACENLSKITRTSYGPNGMNKMVINHIDKLFVTGDSATIVRELEVAHPAAKMVVMAAQMQEREVGDGSNYVLSLTGELLHKAAELIKKGLHPSDIIEGFTIAGEKAQEILNDLTVHEVKEFTQETLERAIKAAIASKQFGWEDFLAPLVAKACLTVLPKNTYNFNVDNVRVAKLLGGNLQSSEVIKGMVIPGLPAGTVHEIQDANIACFSCPIDTEATETKGTVMINNAEELLNYNEGEEQHLNKTIKAIADSGVNVVVTTGSIGEMALHFLNKYGIMCIRLHSKFEFRRVCRAAKASPLVKLEAVHPQDQGFCKRVYVKELGLAKCVVLSQEEKDVSSVATILLRASTNQILADVERAIDDGVNTVKAVGRDGRFLAGAGACDIELARRLIDFGEKRAGVEQHAIKAFGEALEVGPRMLAESSGMDTMEAISDLYASHEKNAEKTGIDVQQRKIRDMTEENIFDHQATKAQALLLASKTACTILRVDQIIQAKPAGGPKMPKKQGHWDDLED